MMLAESRTPFLSMINEITPFYARNFSMSNDMMFDEEMPIPSLHSVVVGNVGVVYSGDNKRDAYRAYTDYVILSKEPYGRAAGEDVTWFTDGEITKEYTGILYTV